MPCLTTHRGQFIPMAAMVILSVSVFMVGIVNVYKISRAKLHAQNIADTVALYVAGKMAQSINFITDRNEWMNHFYANPNDPNSALAGSDPCWVPQGHQDTAPPGLGCFIANPSVYRFHAAQSVQSYARLIQTINQIQTLYQQSFNTLLSAGPNVVSANGQMSLMDNLLNDIPDLRDPRNHLVVYNSQQTQNSAENAAQQLLQAQPGASGSGQSRIKIAGQMEPLQFTPVDIGGVRYCAPGPLGLGCSEKRMTLQQSIGAPSPIGYMDLNLNTAPTIRSSTGRGAPAIGAGAIVTTQVDLIGLGSRYVQARSAAYMVASSGSIRPNTHGSFRPTYWVRLGKP